MKKIKIASGAGYAGDRIEPAIDIMEHGDVDYISFECLAERTISLAHAQMLADPDKGYNELLEYRMERILPVLKKKKIKVITNMGAANPKSAARVIKKMAADIGIKGLKIAAVTGDDILDKIDNYMAETIMETGKPLSSIKDSIVSANAYIGTDGIIEALKNGADIVVAGRVSDPALFLAPLMYEFKWSKTDYDKIGKGILTGHLLECGAQAAGGYFADPGYKDVNELWNVGFPIAEVDEEGSIVITKLASSGGCVTEATCKEQMVYEIHDPKNYFTPDGTADFSNAEVKEIAKDRVLVTGAAGKANNGMYKVNAGYKDCWIGEGEISYGGSGCLKRAQLSGEIIRKRIEYTGLDVQEIRIDYMGVNSLYGAAAGEAACEPAEVRLRVAARTNQKDQAEAIGREVEALYLNGPAGGGGVRKYVKEVVSVASILIPQSDVKISVSYEEV